MSNLEWLNQQIEETKKSYDAFVLDYELFHRIGDKRDADKLKEILKHLQQIKCELEAWEVVKKHLEYFEADYWNGIPEGITMTSKFYRNDYPIIKKALEIEDE
jgi:hypothetical protein